MQTHGGVNAEEAITASERRVFVDLKVDWDRDGTYDHFLSDLSAFVDNITVDRALTGSAPEEITLVEGNAAAELTFDIGGDHWDGRSWVATFSPYNGTSAFYSIGFIGAEVRYRLGVETPLGIVWYNQFIGNIRTATPNRQSDTVSISALDRVEKLRRPIFMTDWAILDLQANTGFLNGQLVASHWVMDHCLKTCKTSASGYRWPDPEQSAAGRNIIFISGNGGSIPNLGWVDGSWQNEFPPDDTPSLTMFQDFGQANPNSPEPTKQPEMLRAQRDWGNDSNLYWARDRDALQGEDNGIRTHTLGFTLHIQDLAGSQWFTTMPQTTIFEWHPRENRTMRVIMSNGEVWIQIQILAATFSGTHLTIPTTGATHARIVAEYDMAGYIRLRISRPGLSDITTGIQNVTGLANNMGHSFHELDGLLKVRRVVALQDIALGAHDLAIQLVATPGEAGVAPLYTAVLDRGLNSLSFLPSRRGSIAWDVITEVAAAEFGAVFWDESGVFHFWNQDTILAKKAVPVRTFTIDQVQGLQMTVSTDSVRNYISVTSKRARTQKGLVYQSQGPDEYIAHQLTVFDPPNVTTLWLDNVVTPSSNRPTIYAHPDDNFDPGYPNWDSDKVQHGLVEQIYDSVAGGFKSVAMALPVQTFGLWMYRGPDGDTKLRYNNGFAQDVRFAIAQTWDNSVIPEGTSQAAFKWEGSKLSFFDDTTFTIRNDTSINQWGAQGLPLSGDWYQEFYNRNGMLDGLLLRTADPVPTTDAITVPGDPRLQLGDCIQVTDPYGLGELLQMQILGITRSYSKDAGLVDTLTVELTEPTHIGIWDSPQYGIWDQTFYWSD